MKAVIEWITTALDKVQKYFEIADVIKDILAFSHKRFVQYKDSFENEKEKAQ